jgi:hypothetical protein
MTPNALRPRSLVLLAAAALLLGSAAQAGLTSKYAPLPTPSVVAMGSIVSAGGLRTVTLVAPSKISIDGPLSQRRTASFTTLRLTFLPEPSPRSCSAARPLP